MIPGRAWRQIVTSISQLNNYVLNDKIYTPMIGVFAILRTHAEDGCDVLVGADDKLSITEPPSRVDAFVCMSCDGYPEDYMVSDSVWEIAIPGYATLRNQRKEKGLRVLLCLACLEKRAGRPLVVGDFPELPVNRALRFGYCLGREEKYASR